MGPIAEFGGDDSHEANQENAVAFMLLQGRVRVRVRVGVRANDVACIGPPRGRWRLVRILLVHALE